VLSKSELPPGVREDLKQSGSNMLEREGGNGELFRLLRPHGFVADYGAQYYGPGNRIAYVESIAFLFTGTKGASAALAAMHGAFRHLGQGVKDVAPPRLGDESWGVSGVFFPKAPPGYFYAWRVRNLILSFTMSGAKALVTVATARAYAAKLNKHAR
jgi:hypothetical protein